MDQSQIDNAGHLIKNRMRVLLLITQMEIGGAQSSFLTLASGLTAHGCNVTVVTMYDKRAFISAFEKEYDLQIINLEMSPAKAAGSLARRIWLFVRGLWRLHQLLRQREIDILQTFTHYSNIIGPFAGGLAKVPVRISSQRMSLRAANPMLRLLDRLVVNSGLVHKMTAVSEATRQFCIREEGMDSEKVVTIHNGVDVSGFPKLAGKRRKSLLAALEIDETSFVAITVARLHPQKGHIYLLKAAQEIKQAIPEIQFLFIGDGPLQNQLEQLISELRLEDYVHMLGARTDIPDLLAISDMFVLPSIWEGLPNSILEAMASGLPIVATEVDGLPELIENRKTGLLIPPADPGALTEAILQLHSDSCLGRRIVRTAREKVASEFSVDQTISRYLVLYTDLLSKSKASC